MKNKQSDKSSITNKLSILLLMLALTIANSILFYFVIWDMLSPSKPYTVILFFISGSAHLIYFFLPWLAIACLGPIFRGGGDGNARFDRRGQDDGGPAGAFVTVVTQFGMVLCVSAIGLWFLQSAFEPDDVPRLALITEANCLEIGGAPDLVDGLLICIVKKKDIGVRRIQAVASGQGRI